MTKLKSFLFPAKLDECHVSTGLLIIRIVFGLMLVIHGWGKMTNFGTIAPNFMGGSLGLSLVVFAEVFCALGVVTGLLFRLALIPLIINMGVAFFIAHGCAVTGAGSGEMALLYLAVFVGLFFTGAGKFSLDAYLVKNYCKGDK